jgi:glycosyltransferase involved in cell wall biosynthesis
MHILFLTDNFPPEVNAPASRTFEHCRHWVRAGHDVTVVTCAPNFPKGVVYAGYRNWFWQSELMDGIRVVRCWTYMTANEGFLLRSLDYMSFMFAAVAAAPFIRGVDVVIGTSPHFFTVCGAYAVSRVKRIPFIFELRDLWPDSIKALGALSSPALLALLTRIELHLYRSATRIVAVTNAFKSKLSVRGIDPAKIEVVTNGVDISRFKPQAKDPELIRRYGLEGKFVAGYIGTHGLAHSLRTLLEAADSMRRRPNGDAYKFVFLGDGAMKAALIAEAKTLSLDNIIFLDSVPKSEVVRHWAALDASIVHLRKDELFTTVIPSKIFEAMAMGIPILHGVLGESAEIVEREGVGLTFEPENPDSLCAALTRLASDAALIQELRTNALAAAQRYNREALAERMLEVIESTVARRSGQRRATTEQRT